MKWSIIQIFSIAFLVSVITVCLYSKQNGSTVKNEDVEKCFISKLTNPNPGTGEDLVVSCLRDKCPLQERDSVLDIMFNYKHGEKQRGSQVEEFKEFLTIRCDSVIENSKCVANSISMLNTIMVDGSNYDVEDFKELMSLAMFLVPNLAFCEASNGSKNLFYEFLSTGGMACVSGQNGRGDMFFDMVANCVIKAEGYVNFENLPTSRFLKVISQCGPTVVSSCKDGSRLESLFNQTIVTELHAAHERLWSELRYE